jgi:hypothetical protein
MSSSQRSIHPISISMLAIAFLTVVYILVYQYEPFPDPWNDVYLNLASIIPAFIAAILATRVMRSFHPDDQPRRVWLYFALGLWSWAVAELCWFLTFLALGDVPTPSLPDVFWLLALVPLTISFLLQYRLIYTTPWAKEARWLLWILGSVLVVSLVGAYILHHSVQGTDRTWGQSFLDIFYATTDLALALAGLGLARAFRGGLWGRAWLALLVMALSDALYSWATFSGTYAVSVETGNPFSLLVDLTYTLAYMLLALACYSQFLLVRYGPTLAPPPVTS